MVHISQVRPRTIVDEAERIIADLLRSQNALQSLARENMNNHMVSIELLRYQLQQLIQENNLIEEMLRSIAATALIKLEAV